ncbi:MAG: hypothetical protein JW779_01335 [Candidatus Thorarchaeota archaeon]|nr:hypothetical protein [Candidatus Thorarchaeota archaeon]
MGRKGVLSKRNVVLLCTTFVTLVLSMQLVATTAWTADVANAGPGVTIVQLSDDSDSDWATQDLISRLSEFIHDDIFFRDRISVIKTDNPHVVVSIADNIVIYVSHGGPLGIVTGKHLTTWSRMAQIVENSKASIHLFTACSSKNIIRHGSADSTKQLYTVPGARPAEVTNVEITTTVLLALGFDTEYADQYRTSELTKAKELVETGKSVHIMVFEEIILTEIENIDNSYNETWTDDFRVYREAVVVTYTSTGDFYLLPYDLKNDLIHYYRNFVDTDGVDALRELGQLYITYTKNYYINSTYTGEGSSQLLPDSLEFSITENNGFSDYYETALFFTSGGWVNETPVFTGGTYSGWLKYAGDHIEFQQVVVNVTASGSILAANETTLVDSISLQQIDAGGTYLQRQKIDGVWQEPSVGRNPRRTGGLWTDPGIKADYEYESGWTPPLGYTASTGVIHSSGEYIYIDSIPSGTSWHGPSFVNTLPSYFRMNDFGSFSANISMVHGTGVKLARACVTLYDENKKVAMVLMISDASGDRQEEAFYAYYYHEDGTGAGLGSQVFTGDTSGIVQIRYDPHQGIYADVPGKDEVRLFKWTEIDPERVIKYVAVHCYRYSSYTLNDARFNSIQVNYAGSEYTVLHDNCNDVNNFHLDDDFGYGTYAYGDLYVPSGQSYMSFTNIPTTPSGWHGPDYVHVLDRPFRLCQLSEFSVIGELVQSYSTMGNTYVALFDENEQIAMLVYWGDAWAGSKKGWFNVYFYPQNGGSYSQESGYIYTSFLKTATLWWGSYPGIEGSIYSKIDGTSKQLGQCYNASRVIKYVVLLGYRYSHYGLVDMRIHDINVVADLKWNQRALVLTDDCENMDNFENDPTFGWGTVSAGELYVPSGQSYMTSTGIPTTPSGWHGPTYVHELEAPFSLYNLYMFNIHAELFQYYDQRGLTEIALFDVDKQPVLKIYWGDSSEEMQGYFHVAYYPQGGSTVSDTTGYIYTSFYRIGEFQVVGGHMMYKIKDQSGTLQSGDMGAVANPYRQVKYLAIRMERYSADDMNEMRLHAIQFSATQETLVPVPEDNDGTLEGKLDNCESQGYELSEYYASQANSELLIYWTGPWPELHFQRSSPSRESNTEFHLKANLIHEVTLCSANEGNYNEPQGGEFYNEVVIEFLVIECTVCALMFLALLAVDCYQTSLGTNWVALLASAILATSAIFSGLLLLKYFYDSGFDIEWVGSMFFLLAVEMLTWAWGDIILWIFIGMTLGLLFQSVKKIAFKNACSALDFLWIKKIYLTTAAVFFFIMAELCYTQGYL